MRAFGPLLILGTIGKTAFAATQDYVVCDPIDPAGSGRHIGDADEGNLLGYIQEIAKGNCNPKVGAHSCNRIGCGNTSGIYFCNLDGENAIETDCAHLAKLAMQVYRTCGNGYGHYRGGTIGKYNIYIGYANCNASPARDPWYQSSGD